MKICHVNLAKGYRGGERQTEMLIKSLAKQGLSQNLLARFDSPLHTNLKGVENLQCVRVRKPYFMYGAASRGVDLMHAHEAKAAQFAYLASRFTGVPYLITRRVPRVPGSNAFTSTVYRKACHVVALSRAIKQALQSHNPDLAVSIIPSMTSHLPCDSGNASKLKQRYADKFVIGHVGALVNKHKGQRALIGAARQLASRFSDMHFLLLGSGYDEAALKAEAQDLQNVEFVGFVENVGDYLKVFDVFAYPSLEEGLGSALLDAMDYRLPIVASNVGGIPDIVSDQQTGLLVPPGNAGKLAEALARLYEDKALRHELAANAYNKLSDYYPEAIAARYASLYEDILGDRN